MSARRSVTDGILNGTRMAVPRSRRCMGSCLIKVGTDMEPGDEVPLGFPVRGLRCKAEFTNDRPNQAKTTEASGGRG